MRTRSTTPQKNQRPLQVHQILVPVDFSGQSRQALECAVPMARQFGAKISLLHVVQPPLVLRTLPDGSVASAANVDHLVPLARARLVEMTTSLLPAEVRGRPLVRQGSPHYEIIAAAQKLPADLVVMSTHGFTGLKRALLGSTAENVVRYAPCPVLTVRRKIRATALPPRLPALPWRRILVPVDFSITSLRVLEAVVPLARAARARVCLLHVVEPAPYASGLDAAVLTLPVATQARNARSALKRVARRFVGAGAAVSTRVEYGPAARTIAHIATTENVDLIALSTHGHSGWDRLFLGSTAGKVVRLAACPVLVLRQLTRPVKRLRNLVKQ